MNKNMNKAKANKNDEFYTSYKDIENEVLNYKKELENKIIYCNCDDVSSNFYQFFYDYFHKLNLGGLCVSGLDGDFIFYDGTNTKTKKIDGDFRSEDATRILQKVDVVITNPPFSLFREYVAQLIEYEKKFLIIGNFNAITYKKIFPLIKDSKIWLGYNSPKEFVQPDGSIKKVFTHWFTNMDVLKRHEDIVLYKVYKGNEDVYPKYDNYDAIEVSKVKHIPRDYEGVMGVPITFLTKYNPNQFEILGSQRWAKSQSLLDVYTGDAVPAESDKKTLVDGKETYDRIFIKNKNPEIK